MTARAARQTQAGWKSFSRPATLRKLEDRRQIMDLLAQSPAFNAYAIAHLDAELFGRSSFYVAESGESRALLLHARSGPGPAIHLWGDARLAGALAGLHPGYRSALLTCQPDHVDEMLAVYNLWRPQTMLRLRADRDTFQPPAGRGPVRRLLAADAGDLNRLYAMEGDGVTYSGRHIRDGVYFGAIYRGRIVAAAGTHIYSRAARTGVVGNVFTHPDFRGHGFGTAVTAAVTAQLLEDCDLVVLSVDPANRSARHIYETLGYREAARMVEAMATRRSPFSPLPLLRRFLARRRSSAAGSEVVHL